MNEIIESLRQKDPVIIRELLDAYGEALYSIIFRIVHSHELAEEVLQETFVKVWKNGEKYDLSKGQLFTWLINIARHTAIDVTRNPHFQHQSVTESLDDLDYWTEPKYTPVDYPDLLTHVAALEKKYHVVIELFYFEEYTLEEISIKMNIPLGTVKTRLRSALERLRKIYPKDLIHS